MFNNWLIKNKAVDKIVDNLRSHRNEGIVTLLFCFNIMYNNPFMDVNFNSYIIYLFYNICKKKYGK